jgi:hypothetical protein
MLRVSKKKLVKILKGDYDPPTMTKSALMDYLNKPTTHEEWLKGYNRWKKQQSAKN